MVLNWKENFSACLLKRIIDILLRLWPLDLDLVFKSYYQSLLVMSIYILVYKEKKQKEQI